MLSLPLRGGLAFWRKTMEQTIENIIEGISGINFSVNEKYINKQNRYYLKTPQCSCTKIGNFYMLYINQAAIYPTLPLIDSVVELLAQLFHFGVLSFYESLRNNYEQLLFWIKMNLSSIIHISEISLFWDYPESFSYYAPNLTHLETTLLRHNTVWIVYDKRSYISHSQRNYRDYFILIQNPIRMEMHITLKNCDFLSLDWLNYPITELLTILCPYIQKSHLRWSSSTHLLSLPRKYNLSGRIEHTTLPRHMI